MGKINIAIAGAGNCASAFLQGVEKYRHNPEEVIGLMHYRLGEYTPGDINVVAAFDVDQRKVGKGLREALKSDPNCTSTIWEELPEYPVTVKMGPLLDGVSVHMKEEQGGKSFIPSGESPCDVVKELKESGADMLLVYLPVGAEEAVRFYARACLEAGIGLINAIPVFIASDEGWAQSFWDKNLPLIGDDVKGQMGATMIHRALARLFEERGVILDRTYQLNFGGNTDFFNMLNVERVSTKKDSKTRAVQSELSNPLSPEDIHIGPSDYVPWLNDNKIAHIKLEGRGFGGVPLSLEVKLSVEDSPNSGGVMVDAVRCMKLALNRGIGGPLYSISACTMKSPPQQYPDTEAGKMVDEFISGKRER